MTGKLAYTHPGSKLAITAFTTLTSIIVLMIIGTVVAIPFFGIESVSSLVNQSDLYTESNITLLKYMQLIQSVGFFILPSILLALLFGTSFSNYLQLNKKPFAQSVLIVIIIVFAASPVINVLAKWNESISLPESMNTIEIKLKAMEASAKEIVTLFLKTKTTGGLIFNILLIAIIPAIGEEFLFRGVIQQVLNDWFKNHHWAIWITAIAFSALHFQFYGFIPRMLLGAMFGYMLIWSKNLWLPIIAHFINNASAVLAYHFYNNGKLSIDPDQIGTSDQAGLWSVLALIVVGLLFYSFYKVEKNNLRKNELKIN